MSPKKASLKKLRPLGQILLDIEPYILEMADHELQHGDYYGLLGQYLKIHLPGDEEEYTDNTQPVFFYGHEDALMDLAEKIKKRKKI